MDRYADYNALRQAETEGQDFEILQRPGRSGAVIMAPHAGGIEPGTLAIADALAGAEHGFYAFRGLKSTGNAVLHITSTRFDEPRALTMAAQAEVVVTIHGHHQLEPVVFVGGRHRELKQTCCLELMRANFDARLEVPNETRGMQPNNLCNRCRSGQGLQIEISRGLRELLFERLASGKRLMGTPIFSIFVEALRLALRQACRQREK